MEQTLTVRISRPDGFAGRYLLVLKSQGHETTFPGLTAVDLLVLVAHIQAAMR